MKNLLLFLVALLIPLSLTAQTVDSQSQKLIDDFVKSNIDLQITPVDPAAVSKVFDGTFFKLGVGFIEAAGASSCGDDNYVNINGNIVKMAEGVHMKKETQWIFIRDKFFDDYTAFIVTVGTNGAISKIEVKLAYTVN